VYQQLLRLANTSYPSRGWYVDEGSGRLQADTSEFVQRRGVAVGRLRLAFLNNLLQVTWSSSASRLPLVKE